MLHKVYRGTHKIILDTTVVYLGFLPFLSLERLQKLYSRYYIIPPIPPWLWSG